MSRDPKRSPEDDLARLLFWGFALPLLAVFWIAMGMLAWHGFRALGWW